MAEFRLRITITLMTALPLLFLLSGCWSTIELNDRAFARIIIFDKGKQGIELTMVFPLPNRLIPGMAGSGGGPQTGNPYTFISKEGANVGQALRNIQIDLSRKITLGQSSVVIIGKELAQEGIGPVLEFLAREPRIHINASMFVTEGKGKELANIPTIFERFPTDILTAYVLQHETIQATVKDFLMANYTGGDMVAPLLSFQPKKIVGEKGDLQDWMGVGGAAVFKNKQLQTTVGIKDMRGALWILGQLTEAEITIPSPTDGRKVSFFIEHTRTKIKPRLEGEKISIHIQSTANARLLSSDTQLNVEDPNQLSVLAKQLESEVEKRMMSMIDKTREVKADAFHLGNYISWYYPQQWKTLAPQWMELYSNRTTEIAVHADINIRRLGTEQKSVEVEAKES
ncbi:Ger(x)C family spore germination protein [Paenibacillus sp. RC67]|uniref:Ger(x)C family spore germination protein n=1 Tax=Paenibacillus sp. RC67 TaxID=3039392 RepID=UPI0024ACACE8|nr:Ger(x)C family spore germination protein [Paenibacillus sp. RC67]